MNFTTDPNAWVIAGLVFFLGLLIGTFLTAGGRRKWKQRYKDEVDARHAAEAEQARLKQEADQREKEWRDRDALRGAAVKNPADTAF